MLALYLLLLTEPAFAQRTTTLTTPRQTLTVESQADRDGQTVLWQRGVTTESGETFRHTTEATFDGNGGVDGHITGDRGSASFAGTTQRDGNTLTHQRTVEIEQGYQSEVNSEIELSGTGSFSGSRTRSTSRGNERTLEFRGSR